jgi:hypothetical protein
MGMTGGLDEIALTHLVQMTSVGRKTGRLVLCTEDGTEVGELWFRRGRLALARCGALPRARALYALLSLQRGTFSFEKTDEVAVGGAEQDDLAVDSLLMEGIRRLDELHRLRMRFPATAVLRPLGGEPLDAQEARVLSLLRPGARSVGDVVAGVVLEGDADELDALEAVARLRGRGIVRVEPADEPERGASAPAST